MSGFDPNTDGRFGYNSDGPDRDYSDFSTWKQANDFCKVAGGPDSDLHRLDGHNDGVACEALR